MWLEFRLCGGRAAGGSNWAQLAAVNSILLVYSGEIVNRWHSAVLFVGEGHNISCYCTFSLLSVALQKSVTFYAQFNLFNVTLSCLFFIIGMVG